MFIGSAGDVHGGLGPGESDQGTAETQRMYIREGRRVSTSRCHTFNPIIQTHNNYQRGCTRKVYIVIHYIIVGNLLSL